MFDLQIIEDLAKENSRSSFHIFLFDRFSFLSEFINKRNEMHCWLRGRGTFSNFAFFKICFYIGKIRLTMTFPLRFDFLQIPPKEKSNFCLFFLQIENCSIERFRWFCSTLCRFGWFESRSKRDEKKRIRRKKENFLFVQRNFSEGRRFCSFIQIDEFVDRFSYSNKSDWSSIFRRCV